MAKKAKKAAKKIARNTTEKQVWDDEDETPVVPIRKDPRLVGNCPHIPRPEYGDKDPLVVEWYRENEPEAFELGGRYYGRNVG